VARGVFALASGPALFMPRHSLVVLADIHLGYESALARTGVFLPIVQLRKAVEVVRRVRGRQALLGSS
jgi:metallophosphoesterase superfamily enzyme